MEHVVRTERGAGKEAKEKILEIQERLGYRTEEAFAEIRGLEGISVEENVYDHTGNCIQEKDKNGNIHIWEYNIYGQVTAEKLPRRQTEPNLAIL